MKKMKTNYILKGLFVFFLGVNWVLGQGDVTKLIPKKTPESPNVASLGKYVDIPVGNYTGTPNISIPIHTVQNRSISVPISISYHASGIKVEEEASWVGLGWSLNAGGVIRKTVKSRDDFSINGMIDSYQTYQYLSTYDNSETPKLGTRVIKLDQNNNPTGYKLIGVTNGNIIENPLFDAVEQIGQYNAGVSSKDAEPDLFSFNFGGYTGKFYIVRTTSRNYEVFQVDQSPLKIRLRDCTSCPFTTDFSGQSGFVITTPDGTDYEFTFTERQWSWNQQSTVGKYTETGYPKTGDYGVNTGSVAFNGIIAWYLTKIKSHLGDEITFNYDKELVVPVANETNHASQWNSSDRGKSMPSRSQETTEQQIVQFTSTPPPSHYASWQVSETKTDIVTLSEITFNNGSVSFTSTDRTDLRGGGKKLDDIVIYSGSGTSKTRVSKYSFTNDYFDSDPLSSKAAFVRKRLKLNGLTEYGKTNLDVKPSYDFSYYEKAQTGGVTITLPDKESYQQDYWGFFNGASSNDVKKDISSVNHYIFMPNLPSSYSSVFPSISGINGKGANREVEGGRDNPSDPLRFEGYMKIGTLQKIKYPTGGNIEYSFEPHKVDNLSTTFNQNGPSFSGNRIVQEEMVGSDLVGGLRIKSSKLYDPLTLITNETVYEYPSINFSQLQANGKLMFDMTHVVRPYIYGNAENVSFKCSSSSTSPTGQSAQGGYVGYSLVKEYQLKNGNVNGSKSYEYINKIEKNYGIFCKDCITMPCGDWLVKDNSCENLSFVSRYYRLTTGGLSQITEPLYSLGIGLRIKDVKIQSHQ
jgi:hypothetical protein